MIEPEIQSPDLLSGGPFNLFSSDQPKDLTQYCLMLSTHQNTLDESNKTCYNIGVNREDQTVIAVLGAPHISDQVIQQIVAQAPEATMIVVIDSCRYVETQEEDFFLNLPDPIQDEFPSGEQCAPPQDAAVRNIRVLWAISKAIEKPSKPRCPT